MTIVRCPRCRDEVTMPAKASPRALVRCPLCLEQYVLGEAMADLPPALIVLDGSSDANEEMLVSVGAAELGAETGGDDYRLAGGAFDAARHAGPSSGAGAALPRPAVKGVRPKRKEKSALGEMIKIVLGGVIGLSLGLVVLWWVAGRDDFKLGPKIAPYAPWIVPAKFHGKKEPLTTPEAGTVNSRINTPAASQKKADPGLIAELPLDVSPSTQPGEPPLEIVDPLASLPVEPAVPAGEAIVDEPPTPTKTPAPAEPDLSSLLPDVDSSKTEPPSEPAVASEPAATSPEKALPSAADFELAVLAASEGYAKVNEAAQETAEVRRPLYNEMYQAASEVGRVVTYLSTSDADLAEHVGTLQTFLSALAAQPGKVSALKALTDLNLSQRKHDEGVLVAGGVQGFKAAGSMFECTLAAGKQATDTAILCANNPQDFCQPGDELLIVGRVVEDPQKNIPGYEGDRERVVLYGYSVSVPKGEPAPPPM